jgi:hypothetical protein
MPCDFTSAFWSTSGHGQTFRRFEPVVNDPGCVKTPSFM